MLGSQYQAALQKTDVQMGKGICAAERKAIPSLQIALVWRGRLNKIS